MTPGQVAVVTGGAAGMGRAIAQRLSADGFRVAVLDQDRLGAVDAAGADGLGLGGDVSNMEDVERAIAEIVERFGRLDVLVNNAGVVGSRQATSCHETPIEEWNRVLGVNLHGPFLCAKATLPIMLSQGAGHIITVASSAAIMAFPGRCAYTASKGGALMLTKSIAIDYASRGIRANAICPGWVQTPFAQWRLDDPELRREIIDAIPMGRLARPDEIANLVGSLASESLSYCNGHAFVVDGGWTVSLGVTSAAGAFAEPASEPASPLT